jgi:hypothetical protein
VNAPASERRPKTTPRPVELHAGGGATVTGEGMELMRLVMLAKGLRLEASGLRLTAKAPKCTTIARRTLGLRGNREKLLAQVHALIEAKRRELGVTPEELQALVV